jgi:hypothetical protein
VERKGEEEKRREEKRREEGNKYISGFPFFLLLEFLSAHQHHIIPWRWTGQVGWLDYVIELSVYFARETCLGLGIEKSDSIG